MSGMYESFLTDPEFEVRGVWIDYGPFRVRVARAGGRNKAYITALDKATKPYRRAIETDTFDNERGDEILREVYAQTVVKDWNVRQGEDEAGEARWVRGIEGPGGDILEFTPANVLATFKALPDLFRALVEEAGKLAIYRRDNQEAEAGN